MPKLNLFLSADVEVEPSNIIFNQSLLAPEPTLRTKAKRKPVLEGSSPESRTKTSRCESDQPEG